MTILKSKGPLTFRRGLHPGGHKDLAQDASIEVIPTPARVAVPILQHTGAPCTPMVKPRQAVAAGEKIASAESFVCAPVHAPIAGVCEALAVTTLPNGRHVKVIPIKAEGEQITGRALRDDVFGGDWAVTPASHEPPAIVEAVREAGLVGLGGAAFPTHVKLTPNPAKPVDTLLVNGCECEPYLTADYRVMVEAPAPVVAGALLAARAAGVRRVVIAVEDNKPAAIEALRQAAGDKLEVIAVATKYPMGGERQVVPAVLGRAVPTGALPLDVGVVVMNVGTAAAVARAVLRGKPLTHRVVSVTGGGIATPRNILAPIGITYGELIDFCGGLKSSAARVLAGGPMMGFALSNLAVPVTKGTSGIVVLTHDDVRRAEETPCIRCGRCVDVCPLHLVPTKLAMASRNKDWDTARRYFITACCDCGCCSYICPARIPLTQLIRMGKVQMVKK